MYVYCFVVVLVLFAFVQFLSFTRKKVSDQNTIISEEEYFVHRVEFAIMIVIGGEFTIFDWFDCCCIQGKIYDPFFLENKI